MYVGKYFNRENIRSLYKSDILIFLAIEVGNGVDL